MPSTLRPALNAALGDTSKALDAGDWQSALKRVWASKWTVTRLRKREPGCLHSRFSSVLVLNLGGGFPFDAPRIEPLPAGSR